MNIKFYCFGHHKLSLMVKSNQKTCRLGKIFFYFFFYFFFIFFTYYKKYKNTRGNFNSVRPTSQQSLYLLNFPLWSAKDRYSAVQAPSRPSPLATQTFQMCKNLQTKPQLKLNCVRPKHLEALLLPRVLLTTEYL